MFNVKTHFCEMEIGYSYQGLYKTYNSFKFGVTRHFSIYSKFIESWFFKIILFSERSNINKNK